MILQHWDLNGDGFTGGSLHVAAFDLDRVGSVQFGATRYSTVQQIIEGEPVDVKRLRQLERENGRPKKMVSDRELEIDVLKEITRKKWSAHACGDYRSPNQVSVIHRGLPARSAKTPRTSE
jgi:hypothetical protein